MRWGLRLCWGLSDLLLPQWLWPTAVGTDVGWETAEDVFLIMFVHLGRDHTFQVSFSVHMQGTLFLNPSRDQVPPAVFPLASTCIEDVWLEFRN